MYWSDARCWLCYMVCGGFASVVPAFMLGLLYRIVFVVWKRRDSALIYCRVNLVVPFAREPKHLTICRPPPWIYCFLSYHSHRLSSAGIDRNQNGIYVTRQISIYVIECRIVCSNVCFLSESPRFLYRSKYRLLWLRSCRLPGWKLAEPLSSKSLTIHEAVQRHRHTETVIAEVRVQS